MNLKKYLHKEVNAGLINNKYLGFGVRIVLYIILAGLLLNISWQAWPDIIVDFGQELYMSWRITEGDVIYKDIDYFYLGGPLSVYFNALWFYIFGAELSTMIVVNAALLIILIFLLEDWLKSISDRGSATIAILFFLTIFAFNKYRFIGNYNYLTPYSIPLFHGLIIILGIIASIKRWGETDKKYWLVVSGFLLGLTLINKIEIVFAAIATLTSFLFALTRHDIKKISRKLIIIPLTAAVAPIITILLLAQKMPLKLAIYNVFNQWVMAIDGRLGQLSDLPFYKTISGMDDVAGNMMTIIMWGLFYLTILISILIVAQNTKQKHSRIIFAGIGLFIFIFLSLAFPGWAWAEIMRPLPLLMLAALAFAIYQIKNNHLPHIDWPLRIASIVFVLILMSKIILKAGIHHYGFILSMPAFLLAIVIFTNWIPTYLKGSQISYIFKVISLSVLTASGLYYLEASSKMYDSMNYICCKEFNTSIRTDDIRGPMLDQTISHLKKILKPEETFTVIPEGTMLNFIMKVNNPTPYFHFLPQLYIIREEKHLIDSVAQDPPDYVVYVHSDTAEYGQRFFGKDYGVKLKKWVDENYKIIWRIGGMPLEPNTIYGAAIAQRIKPK